MMAALMNLHSRPLIILFGDSITQQGFGWPPSCVGWVSFLARDYCRRADVLNRGFSGYNTNHAVEILPTILPSKGSFDHQDVLFTTVFFGANDAALPGEIQHVPEDSYDQNLRTIVKEIRRNMRAHSMAEATTSPGEKIEVPVILFTPPPVDAEAWGREQGSPTDAPTDRSNKNAQRYGDVVKRVGKDMGCSVLDVFSLLGGNRSVQHFGKHLRDGLHLSDSGNEIVHTGLMKLLQKDHPNLLPMVDGEGKYGADGVPLEGKLWREMCNDKKSFK
eukprot:scaffold8150_cov118-Cylindrotheca_fusiformis.AAC.8